MELREWFLEGRKWRFGRVGWRFDVCKLLIGNWLCDFGARVMRGESEVWSLGFGAGDGKKAATLTAPAVVKMLKT